VRPGDRCAVEPYLACGTCGPCRRGRTNCCETLQVLGVHIDGGMRERIAVPAAKLHPSPTLGFEALALVETLGIGAHAVARGAPVAGERVLVVGAGPIGLSAVAFALLADAEVWVLEPDAGRRRFCSDRFGVRGCIAPGGDPPAEVRAALGGELPTLVLDATGNADAMRASFRLVASAGRLVLVGIVRGEIAFDDPEFHRRELSLLATRNSTAAEFQRIVRLMENGLIDTGPWITHRAGYDTLVEEFPTWLDRESGVVKAMLAL
jgi:threonine dehydrogenase-like Zn-dependent dehydrogenase